MQDLSFTPLVGASLFIVMVFCGVLFRSNWKAQRPGWVMRAWLYAIPVVLTFCVLAFIPLAR